MHTPVVLDKIRTIWKGTQPLKDWLDRHVGPIDEPLIPTRDRSRL